MGGGEGVAGCVKFAGASLPPKKCKFDFCVTLTCCGKKADYLDYVELVAIARDPRDG